MAIKTIMIKNRHMRRDEGKAAEAGIYPGMLLEFAAIDASDATEQTLKKHATSAGNAMAMFAIEDELQGKNISTVYTNGKRVQYIICCTGDIVYCRIANGSTTTFGCLLESNGDGNMKVHTPTVDSSQAVHTEYLNAIVLQALEVVDMSDSSAADPTGLCKAMVYS